LGVLIAEDRFGVVALPITPVSVAANTTVEQTFAMPGVKVADFVSALKPSLNAGIGIVNARCPAPGTIAIKFVNSTAGAIIPTAETYLVLWFRAERQSAGINL
jgi:hypothetical protein